MSIGGAMSTATSGMRAQATRLSVVSENVANSDTTGYKRSETEFSSLVLPQNKGGYNSGAVEAKTVHFISEQGSLESTGNSTNSKKIDLAIQGNGFLVVGDGRNSNYLTRAGSFTRQPDGTLVNAAGYTLRGYPMTTSGTGMTLNNYSGLEDVNLSTSLLNANPTTKGELTSNLNRDAAIVTTSSTVTLPSGNAATATYTSASSLTVYDNAGKALKLDIYYTKTADNTWDVAVFDSSKATTGGTTKFPYSSGPLQTATLAFDNGTPASGSGSSAVAAVPATFKLKTILSPTTSTTPITVDPTANGNTGNGFLGINLTSLGGSNINLNITNFTQYSKEFGSTKAAVNGNPAEVIDSISIGGDGLVTATFSSGTTRDLYKIPMALVDSPDNLQAVSGNAYQVSVEAGTILMGFGGTNGFGTMVAGALEGSNVDLASELTQMISAQRSYTANSKVFQTGSEILDVLVNLKR